MHQLIKRTEIKFIKNKKLFLDLLVLNWIWLWKWYKDLGLIPGKTVLIKTKLDLNIGWNENKIIKKDKIFENIKNFSDFYFLHSYCIETKKNLILPTKSENLLQHQLKINIWYSVSSWKSQNNSIKIIENFQIPMNKIGIYYLFKIEWSFKMHQRVGIQHHSIDYVVGMEK